MKIEIINDTHIQKRHKEKYRIKKQLKQPYLLMHAITLRKSEFPEQHLS